MQAWEWYIYSIYMPLIHFVVFGAVGIGLKLVLELIRRVRNKIVTQFVSSE